MDEVRAGIQTQLAQPCDTSAQEILGDSRIYFVFVSLNFICAFSGG